jgi:hypothetical protein
MRSAWLLNSPGARPQWTAFRQWEHHSSDRSGILRPTRTVVRPPSVKITDAEIALIKDALIEAGLFGAPAAKVQYAA